MSRTAFLQMLQSYRQLFGDAYPQRDPVHVLKVLDECAAPEPTTQIAITAATGVDSGQVNKIVTTAHEKGWVHREETRTSTGAKMLTLTEEGRRILRDFDQRCGEACEQALAINSSASPSKPAKSRASGRKLHAGKGTHSLFGNQTES